MKNTHIYQHILLVYSSLNSIIYIITQQFNYQIFKFFCQMGKIIQNYALQQIIGQGMYGKVYKAIHLKTKQQYAVKVIPVIKFQQNQKLQECTVNEINILSTIEQSPYIIRYIEMLKTPNNFYFIYQFCNGKTLQSLLKQQSKLPEPKALKIFKQLIQAFKVLNKYNIMHRDLKPDNIFFHNGNLKLGDFGFCKTLNKANDMASTMLGSPIYMAPEVLKGQIYTSKADIWSLGVVLYEMLFGFCPFQSNSIAKLISVLAQTQLKLPLQINKISVATQNLLKKLLVKDQFKRIDWLQLLQYTINEQGQISQKKNHSSKLEQLHLLTSQRQVSKFFNQPLSVTSNNNQYSGFKKNSQNNTSIGVKITGNNNPNISNSNSTSYSANTNSSFNKRGIKSNRVSQQQQSKQNQVNQYQYTHSNSLTPNKTNNNYQTNNYSVGQNSYAHFKKQSSNDISNKRKKILQQHNYCLNSVKTAIGFLKTQDANSLAYAYILFIKIEQKLRKLINDISITDIELQDMNYTISMQIKQIERQINELKQELILNSFDMKDLNDARLFLKSRFKDKNEVNMRLWYDMINFMTGKINLSSKDLSNLELSIGINNYLGSS